MTDRYGCAAASRDRGEGLAGTASTARRWLAVEQSGPWGADAVAESRLPPAVARGLTDLGRRAGARVVLLRRHGRTDETRPRTAIVADTVAGAGRGWSLTFDDPAELLDLDLSGLAEGRLDHGTPLTAPVYLACTHGSHDACCAEFGRTVAAALTAAAGDRAWECSHVGGDRFAANVVVLPDGTYHGRVAAADAAELVARHDAGRTMLGSYRGRTRHAFVVQAAEAALRQHLGEDRLAAVRSDGQPTRDGEVRHVPLVVGDRRYEVEVAVRRAAGARLTCRATDEHRAPAFEAVAIRDA